MKLSLNALNRVTLQRQMLLERQDEPVVSAVEKLAGLQAQYSPGPYVALWTRLKQFATTDLEQSLENRQVVKATGLRGTLHLYSAADFPYYNSLADEINTPKRYREIIAKLDLDGLRVKMLDFMAESPRLREEIETHIVQFLVEPDGETLQRIFPILATRGDLLHAPPSGYWRFHGKNRFQDAQKWLGAPVRVSIIDALQRLLRRYLAAFGPASLADFAECSGLTVGFVKPALEGMNLVEHQDDEKHVLYDLPDATLPDPDTPAPVRYLAPFDNLLLSYKYRDRILPEPYRKLIVTKNLLVLSTFLLDGLVAGVWSTERKKSTGTLTIKPFRDLTPAETTALEAEGESLVRFMEPEAKQFEIIFQKD